MNKLLASAAVLLLASSSAFGAEKTVTLVVKNMYCAACPHIVRASLEAVPGVKNVTVSFKSKTAIVSYDDNKSSVDVLTAATTKAGYPSAPKS
jgi:periplasmic mercuric ion binding protein